MWMCLRELKIGRQSERLPCGLDSSALYVLAVCMRLREFA